MRLFITGGSGYLGYVLANKLSSLYSITSLSQKYIPNKKKKKNIKYQKVNYKSLESLKRNLKGADILIHLVGMNKEECEKKKNKSLIFKEKVTLNILEACKFNNVKKIVYFSSSQIYKDFQTSCIDEKSYLDNNNFYAKSHIIAEKKIIKKKAITYIILRASNIFGIRELKKKSEQNQNLVYKFCNEAINDKEIKIYNPNIIKNFLPISVLINDIKIILEKKKFHNKIINMGSKSLTLHELAIKIKNRLKIKKKKINVYSNQKLFKKNSKHCFTSLVKKFTYSARLFNFEIDHIINLLLNKKRIVK